MSSDNKALLRRVPLEIFNEGKLDLADELFSDDYVMHDPNLPEGVEVRGVEGIKQYIAGFRTGFPDITISIEDQIAEGDKVATRWIARGTHKGEAFGVPATGKQTVVEGLIVTRFANGKIVEEWTSYDALGLMRQIGAV
jgi:steroid delta-isomerase-like uncharacterized protein